MFAAEIFNQGYIFGTKLSVGSITDSQIIDRY